MREKKITVEEVLYLRDKMRDIYSDVHREFEEDDRYYELDFLQLLKVPKEFVDDATVIPTARQLIDVYTDHVDLANARVSVPQRSETDPKKAEKAERQAELLAKFGKGILYRSSVEEDISQLRVAAKHQGLYGLGCIKTVFDGDRWMDKPLQKDGEPDDDYANRLDEWRAERDSTMPIVIQAVNPRNLLHDPSGSFVIEERERMMIDVRQRWPKWSNPDGKKVDEKVVLTSYWDKNFRCELADNEPLYKVADGVFRHKYGIKPYTLIESGLGNLSYDGEIAKRYVGILRYLRGVLISESRNFSLYDVAMKLGALPWYTAEGDNADQLAAFKAAYGDVVKLPKGVSLKRQLPDLAPDAVMRQVEIINSIIMAFAAPRATQGLSETGVRSAAHARTLADLGGVRFQYPSESFRNKVAKVLSNCATIYKNLPELEGLRLWSRTPTDEFDMTIEKKDLTPPFTFYVEFAPYSEEKEYTKHDDLERLTKSGIVNIKWARKQMSNVDWRAMENEDHKDLVAQDTSVAQGLAQMRAAMIQDAIERKMLEANIKGKPYAALQEAPPMEDVQESGRRVMAPSSPKPLPGSPEDMQNQLQGMRGPSMTGQGQGGGGYRR